MVGPIFCTTTAYGFRTTTVFAELAAARNLVRVVSIAGHAGALGDESQAIKKESSLGGFISGTICVGPRIITRRQQAEAQTLQKLRLGVPIGVIPNGIDVANFDPPRTARPENKDGSVSRPDSSG